MNGEDRARLDWALLARFLRYVARHRGPAILTVVLVFSHAAAGLAGPFIVRAALDGPVARGDAAGLTAYIAVFAAAVAAFGFLEWAALVVGTRVGQAVLRDLRRDVFEHLQHVPMSFHDRTPSGVLVVRITNDVENLSELFTAGVVWLFGDSLMLVAIAAAMWFMDRRLALLVFAAAPFVIGLLLLFRHYARRFYREIRAAIGKLNGFLQECLTGLPVIRLFGREEDTFRRYETFNADYRNVVGKAVTLWSLFFPGVEVISACGIAALLWFGGGWIMEGSLTFGAFVAFFYLAQKFFEPIRDLSEKYNLLQAAMAAAERLFAILDQPRETPPPERIRASGDIELDGVRFSYDGQVPVLRGVSLRIRKGERVAIVGPTGAGKTTLAHLLLGLYPLQEGTLRIAGRPVHPGSLRGSVALVAQDVYLFPGTIAENIAMRRGVHREDIARAARIAQMEDCASRWPRGYDTEVGDRGALLSAGERQLVAIARALVADPAVLVLDEATANVDAETERRVQDALEQLMAGRTCILIAHRMSTAARCDRVIVLHEGRIVEDGAPAELAARDGLFARMVRLQSATAAA